MRRGFSSIAILTLCLPFSGLAAPAQNSNGQTKHADKHDISPPLRDIHPAASNPGPPHEHLPWRHMPRAPQAGAPPTAAVQTSGGPLVATTNGLNIAGLGVDFAGPQGAFSVITAPPDPNGAAGVTQFVEWVNTSFAVFDKASGTPIYGPVLGNTLWSGFGGPCETENDGDVIVKYDRAAGRWVFTQLVSNGPPYYQCVAVSTGIDATGTYNRYAFSFTDLPDYPKMGIWPDAYYFSFNQFQGNTFVGANACAMDRSQMIAGGSASMQCFQLDPSFGAILPSDLDGITPPPVGSPNFFVGIDVGSLNVWKLHADFANPANATLAGPGNISVAPYAEACSGGGTCIPQSGTNQKLDSLADRLMYRLAYRNFGDHEALVLNHTVNAGTSAGVRWYEVRDPNGTQTLYQQGTFAPDASYRWMGSIAMDKIGDMALGYSVSSGSMHPAIRYTGRAPSDPLGAMQAETSIKEGTGSQVGFFGIALSRWGDYTSMAIDPSDDCTFWYTNQYLLSNGAFNWSTRIASFSFPSCTAAPSEPDFYIAATPGFKLVPLGTGANINVNLNALGGFSSTVSFSATGLPAGATASFSPITLTGSGSTTMAVTLAPGTPLGIYPVTITAASAGLSHSAMVTLQLYVPGTALFVKTDATTQGTWKGVYGADGKAIANDSTSYPAYAQVTNAGTPYTWVSSTSDVRALQKAAATDRIAATWYGTAGYNIDLNLTDGNPHEVGLYCLDWDNQGRAQTIDIVDTVSGNVLDSRSVSAFNNGVWLLWNLSGHLTIRLTKTGGSNAAVSGIFFNAPAAPDFSVSMTPANQTIAKGTSAIYTVNVGASAGFTGTVNLSAGGLPGGATATFSQNPVSVPGSSTLTVATTAATPGGTSAISVTGTGGSVTHSAGATLQIFVPAIAAFVGNDTATRGTWKGTYGSNGEAIANDSSNYPAYAAVTFNGGTPYSWAGSTSDARALQKAAASDRIASAWYGGVFSIDVNLTDSNPHEVGVYCLDWDNQGRAQTIDILDAANGNVLDSRNVPAFNNGVWVQWNLSGHVTIRITKTGGPNAVISGIFFNAPAAPDFFVSMSPANQAVSNGASTTYTVNVGSSAGFTGSASLSASGLPAGATASFSQSSVSVPGSATLTVTTTATTPVGTSTVTVTGTSGSVSHSGTATLQIYVPATAGFVGKDTSTQGTWKGVYGANGEAIVNDSTKYPPYALVTLNGASSYSWAGSTTDVRALQKAAATDRIASTWYASGSFSIDVNLSDGNPHQVAIYCLDWENNGRAQTIDILDVASGIVVDSRNISAFGNGVWLVWNLSGHVALRVTRTGGPNAAVSGIFFSGPSAPDFSVSVAPSKQTVTPGGSTTYTVNAGASAGFTGTVTLTASGLPPGANASFSQNSFSVPGSATMSVTTTADTPGGTSGITVTGTSGSVNHSAIATLQVYVPATASFVATDTSTGGTWKGIYGASGEAIPNDSTNYPAYAQVVFNGAAMYTWASSTADVRALQKAAASDRIASTWYASPGFSIDVNLTDGNPHEVAVYNLDWDSQGRAQTIDILDTVSGTVLDTRSVSAFTNGTWLRWNLSGHVTIRITKTGSVNAAVSGLFFNN